MTFIAWTEIESFHNIRKFTSAYPENLQGTDTVKYRAKVKLHGTNAAVRVHIDGTVTAQSRSNVITPENDNAGFARWVKSNEEAWRKTMAVPSNWDDTPNHYLNAIFYGEWVGPGVQKGVAVSEIPKRCFAIFAVRFLDKEDKPMDDFIMVEPERIAMYGVQDIPDTYILPWYGEPIDVRWGASAEELIPSVDLINQWVEAVEVNDPWVEKNFNVKGTGEGLVFYPITKEHSGYTNFTNLVFKAKGEKHKNIKTAAPAQIDASVANSVSQFVDMVLTEARLEQGAKAVGGSHIHYANALVCGGPEVANFDLKLIGKFLAWVVADVQKETQDELEASNLEWKQVQKPLGDKARAWYLAKAKQL